MSVLLLCIIIVLKLKYSILFKIKCILHNIWLYTIINYYFQRNEYYWKIYYYYIISRYEMYFLLLQFLCVYTLSSCYPIVDTWVRSTHTLVTLVLTWETELNQPHNRCPTFPHRTMCRLHCVRNIGYTHSIDG